MFGLSHQTLPPEKISHLRKDIFFRKADTQAVANPRRLLSAWITFLILQPGDIQVTRLPHNRVTD